MLAPGRTMLQGWKEIADYVSRDERTVKRWEKQRQLPVRRMPGTGRTNVYVLVAELDDWLNRSPIPAAEPIASAAPAPSIRWPLPAALAALCLIAATTLFVVHAHRTHTLAAPAAAPYTSRVPGVDDLYLRGVYFYEQHTPGSLAQARQSLQLAVAQDPADAPAWATLASTTLMLEQFEAMPETQGFNEAGTAARRALALDPTLADAHATLAFVDFFWLRDRIAAEHEFHTALALDPNSATAHHRFGLMLLDLCRFPQALAELELALRLQPGSTSVVASRALALGFNGHRDDAVATLKSLAAQQPQNPIVWHNLVLLAALPPHNIPLFLDSSSSLQQISHQLAPWPASAYRAYNAAGEPAMWQAIVASETENHVESSVKAAALSQLGQTSAALDVLERNARQPGDGMSGLALDPLLTPLHHDPRFQSILARLGLPPVQ